MKVFPIALVITVWLVLVFAYTRIAVYLEMRDRPKRVSDDSPFVIKWRDPVSSEEEAPPEADLVAAKAVAARGGP